jgi:hypothetical protein
MNPPAESCDELGANPQHRATDTMHNPLAQEGMAVIADGKKLVVDSRLNGAVYVRLKPDTTRAGEGRARLQSGSGRR